MITGIIFALATCFIWGLVYIIPQYMSGFSSLEVAIGRYFFYGAISSLIFLKKKGSNSFKYSWCIWRKAFYFSLISTFGCYLFIVFAVRLAPPEICVLILGIGPVSIALYGNFKQNEIPFKKLIIPSVLLLTGLGIINIQRFKETSSPSSYVLGLICSFTALTTWTWFAVANSRFLKKHEKVRSSDWATLMGVAVLFWVLFFSVVLSVFFPQELQIFKFVTCGEELKKFFIGSSILGVLCSWVATFLWNKASFRLPVSLAGQLTVFETIFGVSFVFIFKGTLPSPLEGVGIFILLIAIIYSLRHFIYKRDLSLH